MAIDDGGDEDSPRKDGGPAFPIGDMHYGMSLRDWFAGHALSGLVTSPPTPTERDLERMFPRRTNIIGHEVFGRLAYQIADAMIAARSNPRSA